jgi:hypothetical protein
MTAPHNPQDYRNTCEEIAAVRKWNDARLAAQALADDHRHTAELSLAAMKPRVADTPWLIRHGKLALAALAVVGAAIVWRVLL